MSLTELADCLPKLSVITVVRNGMPFVEQTIGSVIGQTYQNLEYIVVDGGSTDGTVDVIQSNCSRIAEWLSEKDDGISDAFNKGLALATGDYVLFLNADDALSSSSVLKEVAEKIVELAFPDLIYGDCDVLERNTDEVLYRTHIEFSPERLCAGRQMLPHPCLFSSRSYFEKYGSFDTNFKIAMDYEWLVRGAAKERVVHIPMLVTNVRNGGVSARNRQRAVDEIILALGKNGYLSTAWARKRIQGYFLLRTVVKFILQSVGGYQMFSDYRNKNNGRSPMKEMTKRFLRRTPLYFYLRRWLLQKNQLAELKEWERRGRPAPPPHLEKQRILKSYAKQFGLTVFVETGTYYGDMVEAMKSLFKDIYSIELSPKLFTQAQKRFRTDKNIELSCGDSGKELEKVVRKLDRPALFWLDAHYSAGVTARGEKDTPIFEELSYILSSREKRHVIIIDDARCFGSDSAYPTIEQLRQFVESMRPDVDIVVEMDSIRITPKT